MGHRRRQLVGCSALAASIALLSIAVPAGLATFKARNGPVIAASGDGLFKRGDYGPDIWFFTLAGKKLRQVPYNGSDRDPVWSPDGKRLAFTREPPYSPDAPRIAIWTMGADGRNLHRLIPDALHPAWSPDGKRIAFDHDDPAAGAGIFVADSTDGGHVTQIPTPGLVYAASASFSPDGKRIVFTGGTEESSQVHLYIANVDGSGTPTLLTHGRQDIFPDWSPDGRRIVFTRGLNSTDFNVMVINADGTGERQLTTRKGHDGEASWSPDGRKIVYGATYHNRGPYPFTMNPDGSHVKPLLPPRVMAHGSPIGAGEPAWQPRR